MASPYALVLTYVVSLVVVLGIVSIRTRMAPPYRRWAVILVGAALLDYGAVFWFAEGPGFTLY